MCILSDCEFSSHYFKSAANHKYRVLYTGNDLRLLKFLQGRLKACFVVRAPSGYMARAFIAGKTDYSLFLFDAELPDTTGAELECFTHTRHECTPVVIIHDSENFSLIVKAVLRSLRYL